MKKVENGISTETVDSILRSLGTGTTETKIMSTAYLSHSEVNAHLSILVNGGFIEHEQETKLYKITSSGSQILESINDVREMVGEPRKDDYGCSIF
jgi:predicted transcriptional regulator